MNGSNTSQTTRLPNVHLPQNKNVLAFLKELHPFKDIILPFSAAKVSQENTPADFVGRFAAMSSLPADSKYVIYGSEALVHPDTGIILGFVTGTRVIYRLPEALLQEVRQGNSSNFRVVKETSGMEALEENWVSSPSMTEKLVQKCFEYYGQASAEPQELHRNSEIELTRPRTQDVEKQKQSRRLRLLPLGLIFVVCAFGVLLLYAANYVMELF